MHYQAYKVQLSPNNKQETLLFQHLGCARKAFNWALERKKEAFEKKEKSPSAYDLNKELNLLKKTEFSWMYDSSKAAPQNAIHDCDTAFKNFFARCKKGGSGKKGFPKFKSKKNSKQSFRLIGVIHILDGFIQLPRIGELKLTEKNYIPTNRKVISATVSLKAGKWFVSVLVETPDVIPTIPKNEVIGVDLGSKTLATCSDGTSYANPKALKKNMKKLKRKQRQLSRKKAGSKNREKARKKLAKLHHRIANIRKDAIHKATAQIINDNQVVVLEDLNVTDMLKNRKMSRANSDVGYYMFRRQIEYKAKWNERTVVFADQYFPSSQTCSSCGFRSKKNRKSQDKFECQQCGHEIHADFNASLNLRNYYKNTESSSGIQACGEGGSSSLATTLVNSSMNQEFNRKSENI